MISVIETYRSVVEYCNRDQRGFVTPSVFNTFAGLAQKKIFGSFFSAVATAKGVRINQTDGSKEFSANKYIKEDLSRYIRKVRLEDYDDGVVGYREQDGGMHSSDSVNDANLSLVFEKPADLARIISITSPRNRVSCELVYNDDDMERISFSNLSRPTVNFPVALVGKDIEIFPKNDTMLNLMTLSYYRQPRSLYVVGFNEVNAGDIDFSSEPSYAEQAQDIADPINCRDFDLPEHYKTELVETIAMYIGIRLKDPLLMNKPQD